MVGKWLPDRDWFPVYVPRFITETTGRRKTATLWREYGRVLKFRTVVSRKRGRDYWL